MSKPKRILYIFITFFVYSFFFFIRRKKQGQSWLFKRLSSLGGIYVKFLQLLVLNETVSGANGENFKDFISIYDQADYEKIDIISTLKKELEDNCSKINIDSEEPFAAGSFAQVYSGSIEGQPVVVKVLRPNVIKFLHFDLNLLDIVIHLISFPQTQDLLDLINIFEDFKKMTLQEINYRNEVNNAIKIAKHLADHPIINIPKTYVEFCTSTIIVQEKIIGFPLTKLFSEEIEDKILYIQQNFNTNINFVMEELAVELLSGSLANSGSHGDPHPGNIYILPNNKIALIDFGIGSVVQKNQPELLQLISQYTALYRGEFNPEKLSQAMVSYFAPKLTNSIQTLSTFYGKQDLVQATLKEIGLSVTKTINDQNGDPTVNSLLEQYRMLKLFTQVINKNNRFSLNISFESPEFLRSTQIFMQITRRLKCDIQLLRRAWERVLVTQTQVSDSIAFASYNHESIDNSFHVLAGWFERLRCSDPGLYNRVSQNWGGIL
ncbi:MAG: AarF/UbiB family protein [Candidatus Shapirobacteria bacterium]|nr:AarF/UbiB family protein [Candidatus Shapirobacteria bacterium]